MTTSVDGLFQYKRRVATSTLQPDRLTIPALYKMIVGNEKMKKATVGIRKTGLDKNKVLPQIFPSTTFDGFSRRDNIVCYTGFTHIDFDYIAENGNSLTPSEIRDAMAELSGFVIGAISSRGNGVWAIFYAGDVIKNETQYTAAIEALYRMAEERVNMVADDSTRRPTTGRVIAHDPDCRIADETVFGGLPEPYQWKVPTFSVANVNLAATSYECNMSDADRAREEHFLNICVETSCGKIQGALNGSRHDAAIRAVANVAMTSKEHGITPLTSWGRRIRDACKTSGLPTSEVNDIMNYWKQKTGVPV